MLIRFCIAALQHCDSYGPRLSLQKSLQLRVSQADNVWLFKVAEAPYAFLEDKGVGNFFGKE